MRIPEGVTRIWSQVFVIFEIIPSPSLELTDITINLKLKE